MHFVFVVNDRSVSAGPSTFVQDRNRSERTVQPSYRHTYTPFTLILGPWANMLRQYVRANMLGLKPSKIELRYEVQHFIQIRRQNFIK